MTDRERDARDELWAQAHGPNGAFTLADEAAWYAGYANGFSRARAAEPQQPAKAHGLVLQADTYVAADPATGDRARIVATLPAEPTHLSNEELAKTIRRALPTTLLNGLPHPARAALSELERRLTK